MVGFTFKGKTMSKLVEYANKKGLSIEAARQILSNGPCGNLPQELRTDEAFELLLLRAEGLGIDPLSGDIRVTTFDGYTVSIYLSSDGFLRIANEHPQFDGMTIDTPPEEEWFDLPMKIMDRKVRCPSWVSVTILRKDRKVPTIVKEYFDECYSNGTFDEATGCFANGPWQRSPKRQLTNRAISSAIRVAFGVVGITDSIYMGGLEESETTKVEDKPKQPTTSPKTPSISPKEIERPKLVVSNPKQEEIVDVTEESVDQLIRESEKLTEQQAQAEFTDAIAPLGSQQAKEPEKEVAEPKVETIEEAKAEETKDEAKGVDYDQILATAWDFFKQGKITGDQVRELCEKHKDALPPEKRTALLARVINAELA